MGRIRNPKDFWAGVLFVAVGIAAIVLGSRYNLGTAARMGPGYFPRILGMLLILLGGRPRAARAAHAGRADSRMAVASDRRSYWAASCCSG